jgi:hypothetical protein
MINHQENGRKAKAKGASAEAIVRARLMSMGLRCVERIETGFRVKRVGKKIVGASPIAKVSGDFRAVVPFSGVSVLVEVKSRPGVLCWSALDEHQRAALDAHNNAGALSLLAWVSSHGVAIMQWPLPPSDFMHGHSLQWASAQRLSINTIINECQ